MRKYEVVTTTQFKKDYKRAMRRRRKIELLDDLIAKLARGETLPEKNKDQLCYRNQSSHVRCGREFLCAWRGQGISRGKRHKGDQIV